MLAEGSCRERWALWHGWVQGNPRGRRGRAGRQFAVGLDKSTMVPKKGSVAARCCQLRNPREAVPPTVPTWFSGPIRGEGANHFLSSQHNYSFKLKSLIELENPCMRHIEHIQQMSIIQTCDIFLPSGFLKRSCSLLFYGMCLACMIVSLTFLTFSFLKLYKHLRLTRRCYF